MLPIARKRVLEIPHGLAAIAAAVCLALAFSTDIQSRQDRIMAERADSTPIQQLTGAEEARPDKAVRADQRGESRSLEPGGRRAPMPLFPWFPGLGINGG